MSNQSERQRACAVVAVETCHARESSRVNQINLEPRARIAGLGIRARLPRSIWPGPIAKLVLVLVGCLFLRSPEVLVSTEKALASSRLDASDEQQKGGVRSSHDWGSRAEGSDGLQSVVKLDDFEDPAWPDTNLWRPLNERAPTWWPSSCRARTGSRALWAFGGRIGEFEQPCGAGAPLNTISGIVQRLDLRAAAGASQLELYFDLWLQMPPGEDAGFFIFLRVPDDSEPSRVPIFGVTGTGGEWVYPSRQLDLMALADIAVPRQVYDLRGREWELEWVAHAPRGTAPGAGIYVDDLYLVWEPDAAVPAPTRKPTGTLAPATRPPSPTATPTRPRPSATPVLDTATPTQTPISFGSIYLPRVAYELPVIEATPTPSAEVSPGPSATPGPPSATPTIGVTTPQPFPTTPSP